MKGETMRPETPILDDAARAAGIAGPGYPIRCGAETFYLSRLVKHVRNAYAAWALGEAERNLKAMASFLPPAEYAAMVKDHKRARDAGDWSWGGEHVQVTTGRLEGMQVLTKLLLEHHQPGIEDETVAWLLAVYSCPACKWRGVRPEHEAGQKCGRCGAPVVELSAGEIVKKCCKHFDPEPFFVCSCGTELESVQHQITSGVRELSSADPRIPPLVGGGVNGSATRGA